MNRRGSYWWNLLKGLDYGVATLFGIPAGIYISSYVAYKKADSRGAQPWPTLEKMINWLFNDPCHCAASMARNIDDIHYYYGGH